MDLLTMIQLITKIYSLQIRACLFCCLFWSWLEAEPNICINCNLMVYIQTSKKQQPAVNVESAPE